MQHRTLIASAIAVSVGSVSAVSAETLTIATVNNPDMIIMQELSSQWQADTGNTINWVTFEENILRERVTTDIATQGGQYDIITIGAYETPIWGRMGWLAPLDDLGDDYAYDDIFPAVREGLSSDGNLYSAPFYAESSFTLYRKDLFEAAGLTMPEKPTWTQIREFAAQVHDPSNGVYGVCMRGKPGWGENMAVVGTIVNAFGGRWFDENWVPEIDSPEWNDAISYYVDLVQNYGPPGASSNGHSENRALFQDGQCAIWVDSTAHSGHIFDPSQSKVFDKTSFTAAPTEVTERGNGWFWAWSLGIPSTSTKIDAAKEFVKWATSAEYIELVGEEKGWVAAPPGTRISLYENPAYVEAAPFAGAVEAAIRAVDPSRPTRDPVPYTGVQFVAIPEFQSIGTTVGQQVAASLAGQKEVEPALAEAQAFTKREMARAGYGN